MKKKIKLHDYMDNEEVFEVEEDGIVFAVLLTLSGDEVLKVWYRGEESASTYDALTKGIRIAPEFQGCHEVFREDTKWKEWFAEDHFAN